MLTSSAIWRGPILNDDRFSVVSRSNGGKAWTLKTVGPKSAFRRTRYSPSGCFGRPIST